MMSKPSQAATFNRMQQLMSTSPVPSISTEASGDGRRRSQPGTQQLPV